MQSPPISPQSAASRSINSESTNSRSTEASITVESSDIHALPMRAATLLSRLKQTPHYKKAHDFSNCSDIESLQISFGEHGSDFNTETLSQFINHLQKIVHQPDSLQTEAFNDQPIFKQALLESVVRHLNQCDTRDAKSVGLILNAINRLFYKVTQLQNLVLDRIVKVFNHSLQEDCTQNHILILHALGKVGFNVSDHPEIKKLNIGAVIDALNDPGYPWDNRQYSMALNALGNLKFNILYDSIVEKLKLDMIIEALKNSSYSWKILSYSAVLHALGKLGYRLHTHPEFEQFKLQSLIQSMNDKNKPWTVGEYSKALRGLNRIGFHIKQYPEFRQLDLEPIIIRLNIDLKSIEPISISNLIFSFGKLGFKNFSIWNNLDLVSLKKYILSNIFNDYDKDIALRGWGMLGFDSLLQRQNRRARRSQPLPTIFSAIENPQTTSITLPESTIPAADTPIETPKSTLVRIPSDQLEAALTIQPGEPIADRIAAIKYLSYPKRMIERLQGTIELRNRNGQKSGLLINRLEFLRFLAVTLQHSGFAIKGIYLMGSMVHELLGYKDREDDRDYDFCIQVDGSADTDLAIEKALNELKITKHVGVSKIDNAAIRILKLGFNNTDITITKGNLKYALLDNAIALNISEVLAQWQHCLTDNYPKIIQYYLNNKNEVESALENRRIIFPKKSPKSKELSITWDKAAICFKRLSRGEPFANSEDAIELYSALSNALVSADQSIRNADDENFNQKLQLRSVIYHKFEQLPSSALLHGILDIAVRLPILQTQDGWTAHQTKVLETLLHDLSNWFIQKARQENRLFAVADQLENFKDNVELFAKYTQQLLWINQQFYNNVENDWGRLYLGIESILIYAPISNRNFQPHQYDELYECALGLELLQLAHYVRDLQVEAEPTDTKPLALIEPNAEIKSDKITHWNIFNNNLLLWEPSETISTDENGLPLSTLVLNYYGTALTLSNFKFSQEHEKITADAELISNWHSLKDVTFNTTCEINASQMLLSRENASLDHARFAYLGSVCFKINRNKELKAVIPMDDGTLMFSLDNGKKIHFLEGTFANSGLIRADAMSHVRNTECNLQIKQQDIFKNTNQFYATGDAFIPKTNLKVSGKFLYTNDNLLPINCDIIEGINNTKLEANYQNNQPIFVKLERIFEKQKIEFLIIEKTIKFTLTYTHRLFGEIILNSHIHNDAVNINNTATYLSSIEKWQGEAQIVSINKIVSNINLGTVQLNLMEGQWKIQCDMLRHGMHRLDCLYPLLNFQEFLISTSTASTNYFKIPVYRESTDQHIHYDVEYQKIEDSSDHYFYIDFSEENPNVQGIRSSLKIKERNYVAANMLFKLQNDNNAFLNTRRNENNSMTYVTFKSDIFPPLMMRTLNDNILTDLSQNDLTDCYFSGFHPDTGEAHKYTFDKIEIQKDISHIRNIKIIVDKKIDFFSYQLLASYVGDMKNAKSQIKISTLGIDFIFQQKLHGGHITIGDETKNYFKEKIKNEWKSKLQILQSSNLSNKKQKQISNEAKSIQAFYKILSNADEAHTIWQNIEGFIQSGFMVNVYLYGYQIHEYIADIRNMMPMLPSLMEDLQHDSKLMFEKQTVA